MEEDMMKNKWKTAFFIVLVITVIAIGSYVAYEYHLKKVDEAYVGGMGVGQANLILQQQQTGTINLFDNSTGNLKVKSVGIQELCSIIQNDKTNPKG